jgi:hypothetical protein
VRGCDSLTQGLILTTLYATKRGEIHLASRRTLYLPMMIAAAVAIACVVALSAVSEKVDAAFLVHLGVNNPSV